MRTTVDLDDDVLAAVERERRDHGGGLSATINRLVRLGMAAPRERRPFKQRSYPMGARISLDNVAEVLDHLEGPDHRG